MFWKTQPVNPSGIETLLDKEDIVLKEILNEDYLIEELKCANRRLIEYLTKEQTLVELLTTAISEPDGPNDDLKRYKFCHISCEVLTVDEEAITNAAAASNGVRQALSNFLVKDDPLNPLLSSFFARILCLLCLRQPIQMIEWMKSITRFIDHWLKHLASSAIMDLVFRLVTCIENDEDQDMIKKWLASENIGHGLVRCMRNDSDPLCQSNASHLMCELIRHLRESQFQRNDRTPDALLDQLTSRAVLSDLLNTIFGEPLCDSTLVAGIQVFTTLLHTGGSALSSAIDTGNLSEVEMEPYDPDPERITESLLLDRLDVLHRILENPPQKPGIALPCGYVANPFGNTRLQVVKLIAALLGSSTRAIHDRLIQLGTISLLVDYFFKYSWNNFLHTAFCQCISCLLNSSCCVVGESGDPNSQPSPVLPHLINASSGIIHMILKAIEAKSAEQHAMNSSFPYIGHIMQLANHVHNASQESPHADKIKNLIADLPESLRIPWEKFVSETLSEYNKLNEPDPVTSQPSKLLENLDREDGFPLDSAEAAFVDFQSQKMSKEFPDKFGVSADQFFNDESNTMEILSKETTGDLLKNKIDILAAAKPIPEPDGEADFESLCQKRLRSFDDSGSDGDDGDDEWPERQIDFGPMCSSAEPESKSKQQTDSGPSSDEDEILGSTTLVRENIGTTKLAGTGWADFGSVTTKSTPVDGRDDDWANFDSFSSSSQSGLDAGFDPFASLTKKAADELSQTPIVAPSSGNHPDRCNWTAFSQQASYSSVASSNSTDSATAASKVSSSSFSASKNVQLENWANFDSFPSLPSSSSSSSASVSKFSTFSSSGTGSSFSSVYMAQKNDSINPQSIDSRGWKPPSGGHQLERLEQYERKVMEFGPGIDKPSTRMESSLSSSSTVSNRSAAYLVDKKQEDLDTWPPL